MKGFFYVWGLNWLFMIIENYKLFKIMYLKKYLIVK
jgi:hypothetical protein